MPRSIIQTSPAFATRRILRFHPVEERESLRGGVLQGRHIVRLVDGGRTAAPQTPLLVREARQLVENFGETNGPAT